MTNWLKQVKLALIFCLFFPMYADATQVKHTVHHPVKKIQTKPTKPVSQHLSDQKEVKLFIKEMVTKYNFSQSYLIQLFNSVKIRPIVVKNVKTALEKESWLTYKKAFITKDRILGGVRFWNKYQSALAKAEKIYGVPASMIVATIGVESKYGEVIGDYPVINALATLAFSDTTRAPYFRKELENFLLLTRDHHLNPLTVMGSYAGAIGQPQFMPSSYRNYAINFSGDSKIDLTHNEVDVIGSVANYYMKNDWQSKQPVSIPAPTNQSYFFSKYHPITLSDLVDAGVVANKQIPKNLPFKIIRLKQNGKIEYWYTYYNFKVIKRYNHSDWYAMAVYQLSYYISAERNKTHSYSVFSWLSHLL